MATATNSAIGKIAQGQFPTHVTRNAPPAKLYEQAIEFDNGTISSTGAIGCNSGDKTGRCPKDKRVVDQPSIHDDVWWGEINIPFQEDSFAKCRERAINFLDQCERLYVVDGFAGWDPNNRIKVRIICSRPYHALFMHNMLIRPTRHELEEFGEPDYVVFNAGQQEADTSVEGVKNPTSVSINFDSGEMVILGTEYAGEMKKGVFTIMNYLMPKKDILSMHCSCNESKDGDVALFFGLSGTGKTTLSADKSRRLIGDDEHCWTEDGVFNIEGGCYAKCVDLSEEKEPEIFNAIRFGSVLENTVQDEVTHVVDYTNVSLTPNTRCSYPIEYIDNAKIPCVGPHPRNVIFLTCDAFGVLPPVSRLTPAQAMYHFISGYTAKVAGTEEGVNEPVTTFSACFGAPFLVWHPTKYAELLAAKMKEHGANAWLINTGWSGGGYGVGSRISLKNTRAIIDAIHRERLTGPQFESDPFFGLGVPKSCPGVSPGILNPRTTWKDKEAYDAAATKLAAAFHDNFEKFKGLASEEIINAGPVV